MSTWLVPKANCLFSASKFAGLNLLLLMGTLLQLPTLSVALTNQQDVNALRTLAQSWPSASFSWSTGDPCETPWLGVFCDSSNTVVIKLILPAQGILGILPDTIGNLVNLKVLDLSYNQNLTGSLPLQLFRLTSLTQLYLQNCGFFGAIPHDIGNLANLTYLALNNNFLSGSVPTTIGQLTQIIWLDLSSNRLTGSLPTSLAHLTSANHFHLQGNNFTGRIPAGIFSSKLPLIHLLLYNNSFEGPIPADVGNLTQLDILRLDHNSFSSVPRSLANLGTVTTVQLDHNNFTGDIPDLSSLVDMQILNLGHNQFAPGPIPAWFLNFPNLTSLNVEAGNLQGMVPSDLFSPQNLASVTCGFNNLNGTLDLRKAGPSLTEVDFQQNSISGLVGKFSGTLNLQGNIICQTDPNQLNNACTPKAMLPPPPAASTCGCSPGLSANPTAPSGSCLCAYPVSGILVFTALKVALNDKVIPLLKAGFLENIQIIKSKDQISISIYSMAAANILFYPSNAEAWDPSEANLITALLSSKAILFPSIGPYEYVPSGPYSFPGTSELHSIGTGDKIGIGIGAASFVLVMLAIGVYAVMQKKRADKAEEISKPFVSWISTKEDRGDALKLKGARLFTVSELKKATNNFSKSHEIGVGGYGKVYKGVLPSAEEVAIKRAQASSLQGGNEFKNEIELLSRVHHKNLVNLVGFCFEEQMLVYEFLPNGTLRDSLSGHSNVRLNWHRRLAVSLGSARGLAYLHNEANPPIIHRDVKSGNILLDDKLNAKVADFGLSRLAPDDGGTGDKHVSTQVRGTLGYLDPEYYTTQRLSDKSDVYSLGVVLLELITSKAPIEQGKYIVREVRTALEKGGLPSLQSLLDPQIADCPKDELEALVGIALRSVQESAAGRPTMSQVVKELEEIVTSSKVSDVRKTDRSNCSGNADDLEVPLQGDSAFQYSGGYNIPVVIEPK